MMYSKQNETFAKVKDLLADDFLTLSIASYRLEEHFKDHLATIHCEVFNKTEHDSPRPLFHVHAQGTGLINALFNGLTSHLAEQYPSLRSITFGDFSAKGIMATRKDSSGSDAEALVELTVLSSEKRAFVFKAQSRSIAEASILATLEAVEYFVNSEKAFINIYNSLLHYRKTGRTDLVSKYQFLLTELVDITSYTEVIETIRSSEL